MKDTKLYGILIVEDNLGDFSLIEEFLTEKIASPSITHVENFKEAEYFLSSSDKKFDVILLDLSLPDKNGEQLIGEMMEISANIPIIILTGNTNFAFSVKSLSLGISDYVIKEELTPTALYKSIVYSLERKKGNLALEESETRYSDLFHLCPLPMWVVNLETLQFLDVNAATIAHYGYTYEEFLSMTLRDIRPAEELHLLEKGIEEGRQNPGTLSNNILIHRKKNGDLRNVEIRITNLQFKGTNANVVVATDITERLNHVKAIEEQNEKLKEIAWIQSHLVRAPLARIMGLVSILKNIEKGSDDKAKYIDYISASAAELDEIIKQISDKTYAARH